jgi:hypothetical protein
MPNCETHLPNLSPHEAVADALHRCILGVDSNNHALLSSAIVHTPEASITAGSMTIQGWESIDEWLSKLCSLPITTHFITNVRVNLKSEHSKTASLSAHAIAYHIRPEDALKPDDTSYTAGCLYFIDLLKDEQDGLWKILKWVIDMKWTTGDRAVLYDYLQ